MWQDASWFSVTLRQILFWGVVITCNTFASHIIVVWIRFEFVMELMCGVSFTNSYSYSINPFFLVWCFHSKFGISVWHYDCNKTITFANCNPCNSFNHFSNFHLFSKIQVQFSNSPLSPRRQEWWIWKFSPFFSILPLSPRWRNFELSYYHYHGENQGSYHFWHFWLWYYDGGDWKLSLQEEVYNKYLAENVGTRLVVLLTLPITIQWCCTTVVLQTNWSSLSTTKTKNWNCDL
jgi:hypothetical protein